jgi:hypothetical protein
MLQTALLLADLGERINKGGDAVFWFRVLWLCATAWFLTTGVQQMEQYTNNQMAGLFSENYTQQPYQL